MFEKEAEEIAKDIYIHHFDDDVNYPDVLKAITVGVQKGAEHGYNKAKEWHYPSKGELPECDEETQLIFYVNCYYEVGGETLTRKRMVLGYYKKSFLGDDVKLFVEKSKGYEDEHLPQAVIAWKEIVLPKEMKEK